MSRQSIVCRVFPRFLLLPDDSSKHLATEKKEQKTGATEILVHSLTAYSFALTRSLTSIMYYYDGTLYV